MGLQTALNDRGVRCPLQTLKDEALVVVLVSGVIGTLEGELSVRRGMRLRASHPAVRAAPGLFVAAGLPDDEIAAARQSIEVQAREVA